MNLISYKNSWDIIEDIFQQTYGSDFETNYFNLKNTLFNTQNKKTILYMDTLKKDNNACFAPFTVNNNFTLVLNNTVTDMYANSFSGYTNTLNWTIVFKHDSNEINNINFLSSGSSSFIASLLFNHMISKIIVPEGTKQDYINILFSQMSGWDESYVDKIYEGDEFTEFEEANN